MDVDREALIVEVARYRLEDGPGIRSVVFFKGCALRCTFCHNPESQSALQEITSLPRRCIECRTCTQACPQGNARPAKAAWVSCSACCWCGTCAEVCPTGALRLVGKRYAPEVLAEVLLRDHAFFIESGGGVTLSGGEPALHLRYLSDLLPLLKRQAVHVLMQTSGCFSDYDEFQRTVLPRLDVIDMSLKFADPELHRTMCGHDNSLILRNLRRLAREPRIELQVSIPLVPGVTDTTENLHALAAIVRDAGVKTVRLLPYNPVPAFVTPATTQQQPALRSAFMSPDEMARARAAFLDGIV